MAEPVLRVEPLLKRWVWAAGMLGLGFVGGIVAYFVSLWVLTALGFSFYSNKIGPFLALGVALLGAATLYVRRRRRGRVFAERIVVFLVGMLAFLAPMPWA